MSGRLCRPSGSAPPSTTFLSPWVKGTLGNGTGRFTANVWLGTAYLTKVCQFVKPGSELKYAWLSTDKVAVTMTLRVYDV